MVWCFSKQSSNILKLGGFVEESWATTIYDEEFPQGLMGQLNDW